MILLFICDNFICLKSTESDINIDIPFFICLMFTWFVFFFLLSFCFQPACIIILDLNSLFIHYRWVTYFNWFCKSLFFSFVYLHIYILLRLYVCHFNFWIFSSLFVFVLVSLGFFLTISYLSIYWIPFLFIYNVLKCIYSYRLLTSTLSIAS